MIGVGFDGGAEAKEALDWAAALSRRVGGHLRLIAVQEPFAFSDVSIGAFPMSRSAKRSAVNFAMRSNGR